MFCAHHAGGGSSRGEDDDVVVVDDDGNVDEASDDGALVDDIDEDDKGKIIKAVQAFSIAKGTIDRLKSFGESVGNMMEEVKPVVALKNVEVIKG